MTKYAIFDLNGCLAFFDEAASKGHAIRKLWAEDDSYGDIGDERVYELSAEEAALMQAWYEGGQKTNEWPFDWRSREDA